MVKVVRGSRSAALLVALMMFAVACSGGSGTESSRSAGSTEAETVTSESAVPGVSAAPDGSGTSASGSGSSSSAATVKTAPNGVKVTTPKGGGVPVADLFTAAEDRIGIHPDRIVFCGHAATTFGPAFNTSEADLNVYWEEVGKIYGRKVEISFENDNYDPTTARQAAQACYDKKPFMLLGGIGFDQIPAVRKFAEDKHILYYHHIASQDLTKKYSFSALPSVEQVGTFAGEWIGHKYKGKKIGVIYRQSEEWDPGRQTFLKTVARLGGKVVSQSGVTKNQGSYLVEINDLRAKGAEVVFVWENALAATAIYQEARGQNYSPKFVVFPFNVETDAWKSQALDPTVDGIATWPAYSPGDYSGPFASYASEIKKFEQTYAERRPGVQVTDIHWQVWLAWKALHQLLLECGKDCTRNKVIGLSLARPRPFSETSPACPIDFTRNGHVGGFTATMFTTYERPDGTVGWRHVPGYVCKEHF
jgi:ABC-type branched-subunit amino acid transport system substrate-binding protein